MREREGGSEAAASLRRRRRPTVDEKTSFEAVARTRTPAAGLLDLLLRVSRISCSIELTLKRGRTTIEDCEEAISALPASLPFPYR